MELQELTRDEVLYVMPLAKKRADKYLPYINQYAAKYGVTTTKRMAHFLAQIAQESGQLRYVRELASGAAYDTGSKARALGNTPEKDGDGQRYKGRGLLQITGKANYEAVSKALAVDFVAYPEKLEEPEWAVASALWYWQQHGLNELADKDDSIAVTRRINGGTNGLDDRLRYLSKAKQVFRELCLIVVLVMLLAGCKTQYVTVETVRTETVHVHDTIKQSDSVKTQINTIIREARPEDSAMIAQLGIKLRQNERLLILLQKELQERKSDRQESHVKDSVRVDSVQVPVPVERKLSKWEQFCLDYGKVTTGGTVVCLFLIIAYLVRRIKKPRGRLLLL